MTSRKRNKGKDRKAKKAELEVERIEHQREAVRNTWKGWARTVDINGQVIQCNHGLDLTIPDDKNHPVINFLDTFFINTIYKKVDIFDTLEEVFDKHIEAWKNESYREMAMNILISIGTNMMVVEDTNVPLINLARLPLVLILARAIVILENHTETEDFVSVINTRSVAGKLRDLRFSKRCANKRDVLKFFRKRTACSCLKKIHLEARKTLPKLGICQHCEEVRERTSLMVCSRCGVFQYCSKECQMAHWPSHQRYCDIYVSEQHTTSRNAE